MGCRHSCIQVSRMDRFICVQQFHRVTFILTLQLRSSWTFMLFCSGFPRVLSQTRPGRTAPGGRASLSFGTYLSLPLTSLISSPIFFADLPFIPLSPFYSLLPSFNPLEETGPWDAVQVTDEHFEGVPHSMPHVDSVPQAPGDFRLKSSHSPLS